MLGVNIDVPPPKTSPGAVVDDEADGKGEQPCQQHEVVVPGNMAHDEGPGIEARENNERGQCERGGGNSEDGGATIFEVV